LDFNVSDEIVTEKIIGDIFFNESVDVKELFLRGKTEIIRLNHDVWGILALNRNRIVCSSRDNKCLMLYDENFNLLKTVDKINEVSFLPVGIASYDKHLYITDKLNNCIIMLDFEFNKIKSIGSLGAYFNQFNKPSGICCKNGILYICDHVNQRIQIYNKDLEFIDSVKVVYKPWLIKITNSSIFVEAGNIEGLFIYDLNSLSLKQKIDNPAEYCRLSAIHSNVYRFNSRSKSLFSYDENGNYKEKIIINNVDGRIFSHNGDGTFIDFNGNLLMTSYSGKKLIKFSKK
jgi:hypothetical protein